jgi:enoyl-CoA hydratase/carnithine racemase
MTNPAYFTEFAHLAMTRDEQGVLEVRLHTAGGPFKFSGAARTECVDAFYAISRDRGNRVMILTGTGDSWCAELSREDPARQDQSIDSVTRWDKLFWESRKVIQNLLDIEVPVIGAVNGPALVHSEYLLTCNLLLAADTACFQDWPHLTYGVSPSDGVHVLWPHVLGPIRGSYFLLTQEKLSAQQALQLGVVQEVLPAEQLLTRARALARQLAIQPTLTLRYARVALTQRLKTLVANELGYGLAVEGLTAASNAARSAMTQPK